MSELISIEQGDLLKHTLGDESCYRNYFLTDAEAKDFPLLTDLVDKGYMTHRTAPSWVCGNELFQATDKGKLAAYPEPPTNTREEG